MVSDAELAAAEPEKSRSIEITDFVDLKDIDPVYYNTTYYLAPEGEAAKKAYGLLRQAMAESGKVAIATLVMHNKEYLVAIRPETDVLALETMYFADEVRSPTNELPNLPGAADVSAQELKMANLLIGAMESEWEPERYHDTHRAKVEALIEEKARGKVIVNAGAKSVPATKVVDLMEALSASIAAQSPGEKPPTRTKKPAPAKAPAKRTPAKFTAAKKSAETPAAKRARRKAS